MNTVSTRLLFLALIAFAAYAIKLKEEHASDCTSSCPSGYSPFREDCYQNCPLGFKEEGSACTLTSYGRGNGFSWQQGDSFENDHAWWARCEAAHGKGNCEKYGLEIYPKCRPGFKAFGCCTCQPTENPNCEALGFRAGYGMHCLKKFMPRCPK